MVLDAVGKNRGKCNSCEHCKEYTINDELETLRCSSCGCLPTKHEIKEIRIPVKEKDANAKVSVIAARGSSGGGSGTSNGKISVNRHFVSGYRGSSMTNLRGTDPEDNLRGEGDVRKAGVAEVKVTVDEAEKLLKGGRDVEKEEKLQLDAEVQLENLHREKYVVMPDSNLRLRWDLFMLVLVLYYGISVPVRIAFYKVDPQLILTIDDIANVFFFMDLFFNFLTAVKVDGVYISRRRDIAMHYMQSWFLVDLVSTVPIDQWFGNNLSGEASFNKLLRLLRVFKLFRVFRAARIMRRVEQILKFNPAIKRLGKLLSMLFFQWHIIACSYWYVATLENFGKGQEYFQMDGQNTWVPPPELWCEANDTYCLNLNPPPNCQNNPNWCPAPVTMQYINAFFWAVGVTIGIGRNINPTTFWEHVVTIVMIIIGVLMFALIIGSASSLLNNLDAGSASRRMKMESINLYMRHRNVPQDLQKRVLAYYSYMWAAHQNIDNNESLLKDLHPSLQLELDISLNQKLIENIPMFKLITDSGCLIDLIELLETHIYIPGEYIVVEQELGGEMFIIVHGLVHVIFGGNAIAILKDGDVFGEQSLITKSKRNASVRAITYCDTLVLRKDGFDEVMASYPDFFISLQRLAAGNKLISGWSRVRQAIEMVRAVRSLGDGGLVDMRKLFLGELPKKEESATTLLLEQRERIALEISTRKSHSNSHDSLDEGSMYVKSPSMMGRTVRGSALEEVSEGETPPGTPLEKPRPVTEKSKGSPLTSKRSFRENSSPTTSKRSIIKTDPSPITSLRSP